MQSSIQALSTKNCDAEKRIEEGIEKRFERLEKMQHDNQVNFFILKLLQLLFVNFSKYFNKLKKKRN